MEKKSLLTASALACISLVSVESQAASFMNTNAERSAVLNPFSVSCSPGQTAIALQAFALRVAAPDPNPTGLGETVVDMFANYPEGTEFILPFECNEGATGYTVSEETRAAVIPSVSQWCLTVHADMVVSINLIPGFKVTALGEQAFCDEFAGKLVDFMAGTAQTAGAAIGAKPVTNVNVDRSAWFFDWVLGQRTTYSFADGTSLKLPLVGHGSIDEYAGGVYSTSNSLSVAASTVTPLLLPGFTCTPESGVSVSGTSTIYRQGSTASANINAKLRQKLDLKECGVDGVSFDLEMEVLTNVSGSH